MGIISLSRYEGDAATYMSPLSVSKANWTGAPLNVKVVMDYPSPHTEELLQAFARIPGVSLRVYYRLPRNPFRTWLVAPSGYSVEYGFGPTVYWRGGVYPEAFLLDVKSFFGSVARGADVIVCAERLTSVSAQLTMLWCRLLRRKWLYMNEPPARRPQSRVIRKLRSVLLYQPMCYSAAIVGMGRLAARNYRLISRGRKPVFNAPYACDISRFQRIGQVATESGCRFLFVGQLARIKRVDVLLRALALAGLREAHVDIVGDGPERANLLRMVSALDLTDVKFHGLVRYDEMQRYYANSDVLVMPSDRDGWGVALVEALAAGLPVVASWGVGAAYQLISDGLNGFRFRRGDCAGLAHILKNISMNRGMIAELKEHARRSVDDFNPDSVARELYRAVWSVALSDGTCRSSLSGEDPNMAARVQRTVYSRARHFIRRRYLSLAGTVRYSESRITAGVRIFLYHHLGTDNIKQFEEQIRFIKGHYRIVSMATALSLLREKSDERVAVITFDDGFRPQWRIARGVLARYCVPACYYVPVAFVSLDSRETAVRNYFLAKVFHLRSIVENLNWTDLREIVAEGHEVGAHGLTHMPFDRMTAVQRETEIRTARDVLEERLCRRIRHFAYPYGRIRHADDKLRTALATAGFESAVCNVRGANTPAADRYALHRDHVEADWPLSHLRYFITR